MYVVIVCNSCNGSSQVDESLLGTTVQCPLCGNSTVAHTATAVLPIAQPVQVTFDLPRDEAPPLSLDDARPLPPKREPIDTWPPPSKKNARTSPARTTVYACLSLVLTLVLMGAVYAAFRYGSCDVPASDLKRFAPPDGKCTIDMPGEPQAEDLTTDTFASLGGKRFVVRRWFERVEVSFGWVDFDESKLVGVNFDQLASLFRNDELKKLGGKVLSDTSVNFVAGQRKFEGTLTFVDAGQEKFALRTYVRSLGDGVGVKKVTRNEHFFVPVGLGIGGVWLPFEVVDHERRLRQPGEQLRVYFATVKGKKITPEAAWVQKFFSSFQPE